LAAALPAAELAGCAAPFAAGEPDGFAGAPAAAEAGGLAAALAGAAGELAGGAVPAGAVWPPQAASRADRVTRANSGGFIVSAAMIAVQV
jgi:hypothetical protein